MPYFREYFINRATTGRFGNSYSQMSLESARITGWRSHDRHPKALSASWLTDISVDPYAYFLESTSWRKYQELLSARGLPASGRPDNGHPFEVIKHIVHSPVRGPYKANGQIWTGTLNYTGTELDHVHNGHVARLPSFGADGLQAFGQQAYARSAPSEVVFDAARFLGELREGLPSVIPAILKDRSRFFKSLGSDYLNVAFGWKPFLSDLHDAISALARATVEMSNYGTRVHRRFSANPEITSDSTSTMSRYAIDLRSGGTFPFPDAPPVVTGEYQLPELGAISSLRYVNRLAAKSVTRYRWFEGEFTNFLPLGFDPTDYLQRLNQLVKLKLTPATLWELAPWSWLADWFLRIGDSIRANETNANDLLVMHYGYAMETTVYETNVSFDTLHPSDAPFNDSSTPTRGWGRVQTIRKRRIRANPYGFNVGGASALSSGQFAILGALGLTKAGR